MKGKTVISIFLPLIIITVGIVFNFPEFLMGSPATIKNLIVTIVYLAIWVIALTISKKSKNCGILKCYSVFWIITMFFAIITGYVNVVDANADWAILFAILFLTQWYGIIFFAGSYLTASIIVALISLIMFITTVISLNKAI
jgi:hypothetical protein